MKVGATASGRGRCSRAALWSHSARGRHSRAALWSHPAALLLALLFLLPAVGGPGRLAAGGGYTHLLPETAVLRGSRDDFMNVTYQVAYLKTHPPKRPAVYLLGGSSGRECIDGGPQLAAAVRALGGPDVDAYNLSSQNQNFAQSLAIVDNLPKGSAVVLVGVNENRFGANPWRDELQLGGRELVLDSPALRRFYRRRGLAPDAPKTILPGIANYLQGYWQAHWTALAQGRLPDKPYVLHHYSPDHVFSAAQKRALVQTWLTGRGERFVRNAGYNAALLAELVKLGQQRGFTVVLFDLPHDFAAIGHRFDRYRAALRSRCARIAARSHVPYLRFAERLSIPSADFRDLDHLVKPGRAIFQAALARRLVPLLRR